MKKFITPLIAIIFCFISCVNNNDDIDGEINSGANVIFRFTHHWDGQLVTNSHFGNIQYNNAMGQQLSVERLRYLISDVTFTTPSGDQITLDEYNLVDLTNNEGLIFMPSNKIPLSNFYDVSFTFGLDNEDNAENYLDLNSASFNVPDMLGGGYHYMQFDGKYLDPDSNPQNFNYHAIRAVDNPGENPSFPQDTFFTVDLGELTITKDIEIEVKMNLAEWFRNPNLWDLNELNTVLMPNSSAQIKMYENGQTAFSMGTVIE